MPHRLPSTRRRYVGEWIVLAAALAVIGALIGYTLWQERLGIEHREGDRLQVQARAIDDNLMHQIAGVDAALRGVRDDFFSGRQVPGMMTMTSHRLKALTDALPGMRGMFVLDAAGKVAAASRTDLVGDDFGQRDYFAVAREHPDTDRLYVSRPFKSPLGRWVMNLTRVLMAPSGEFAGVVTASLDPDYFDVTLQSVLYAPDMRAALVHGSGIVFLNMPPNPAVIGKNIAQPGSFFTLHRQSGRTASLTSGRVYATGEDRMVASRTLARDNLPVDHVLVLHVSRDLDALYAPWRRQAAISSALFALLALGGCTALWLNQRTAERQQQASERRLRVITDYLPALISHFDREQRYLFANGYFTALLGLDPASLRGRTLREVRGEEVYVQLAPNVEAALRGEQRSFESHAMIDGKRHHFLQNYVPDFAADGSVQGFYSLAFDITERKESQQHIAASEKRLRDITDNVPALIGYFDADERCRFVNGPAAELFGMDPARAGDYTLRTTLGDESYRLHEPHVREVLSGRRVSFESLSTHTGPDAHFQAHLVPDLHEGIVRGFYILTYDVTRLKQIEQQLGELARHDSLTGLPNRRLFDERLPEAIARSRRDERPVALLVLDVDRFKDINDSHGHGAGDEVLKEFAQRLRQCVRTTDTVARLAGDEFVIILEGLRSRDEAERVAQKIGAAMRPAFRIGGDEMKVTTSVGVAYLDGELVSPGELVHKADSALYHAKRAGRDTFVVSTW